MPLTERLYKKNNAVINVAPTPPNTPSVTPSISITPSISLTPSETPSISITPSETPSISITPTPTPSLAYNYLFNVYNCLDGNCNQFLSQKVGFSYSTSLTIGYYYPSGSLVVQPISISSGITEFILSNTTGYNNCASVCNPISPSTTPSISVSLTPSPTPTPSM